MVKREVDVCQKLISQLTYQIYEISYFSNNENISSFVISHLSRIICAVFQSSIIIMS